MAAMGANGLAMAEDNTLPTIVVQAEPARSGKTNVSGLPNTPEWKAPLQATSYSEDALKTAGVNTLSDLAKLDASVSGAYNTTGYWDDMSIRGFLLEGAYSYRREGLPYHAETRTPLENKANVEVFKGTSGMQAGISAPGGLANLVVKRPDSRVRSAELAWTSARSIKAAADVSERLGDAQQFGVRVNAVTERLNPEIRDTKGERYLLALATDWKLSAQTHLEAEIEKSRYSQPSVPGFSMLGSRLPAASEIDPRVNLNNQPWSLPVVFDGHVGSVRLTQDLANDWQWVSSYGFQRLKTQDRTAFPLGCISESSGSSFCSNGTFDMYDYRSEKELREVRSLDTHLRGQTKIAGIHNEFTVGLLRSLYDLSGETGAYNLLPGVTGSIDGRTVIPAGDPTPGWGVVPIRREQRTEIYANNSIQWHPDWTSWLGLRHTQITRESGKSDGSEPYDPLNQSFTTPWIATGYQFMPQQQVYASFGQGIETLNAPYPYGGTHTNSGQAMPAKRSKQFELGVKGHCSHTNWGVNLFRTERPEGGVVANTYVIDGESVHTGIESQFRTQMGRWNFDTSVMYLQAERRGSANAAINGKAPTNVPKHAIKLSAGYRFESAPGLSAHAMLINEGRRNVLPNNSVQAPAWTQIDVGMRYKQKWQQQVVTWQGGIQNLTNNKAWRSTPYQFSHVYLLPLQPITFTASATVDF